jgi:uncharacterized membrane protein YdjX (TVP38/TMEM64 family)
MEEPSPIPPGGPPPSSPADTRGPHPGFARWAPLAAVGLALAAFYLLGLHRYLTLDALRRYQGALAAFSAENGFAAAAAYLAVYVATVALSVPGASVLTVAGGFMFGCVGGTALALAAATLGATAIFLVARTSLGAFLAERAGPRLRRLREGFARNGFSYLLFLRLVPLFPFWLVNLAAALFGVRLLPYVAATAIGILPGTFVLSYFGEGLGTALGGDDGPFSVELFVALALLGALALVPAVVRRRRRSADEAGAPG